MSKQCPHCAIELTKADYKRFLREQYGDWMLCRSCQGKYYVLLPSGKGFIKGLVTLSVVLPLIFLGAMVGFLAIGSSYQYLPEVMAEIDARLWAIPFILLMGAIYLVSIKVSRAVQWKLAVVQKSMFI